MINKLFKSILYFSFAASIFQADCIQRVCSGQKDTNVGARAKSKVSKKDKSNHVGKKMKEAFDVRLKQEKKHILACREMINNATDSGCEIYDKIDKSVTEYTDIFSEIRNLKIEIGKLLADYAKGKSKIEKKITDITANVSANEQKLRNKKDSSKDLKRGDMKLVTSPAKKVNDIKALTQKLRQEADNIKKTIDSLIAQYEKCSQILNQDKSDEFGELVAVLKESGVVFTKRISSEIDIINKNLTDSENKIKRLSSEYFKKTLDEINTGDADDASSDSETGNESDDE